MRLTSDICWRTRLQKYKVQKKSIDSFASRVKFLLPVDNIGRYGINSKIGKICIGNTFKPEFFPSVDEITSSGKSMFFKKSRLETKNKLVYNDLISWQYVLV